VQLRFFEKSGARVTLLFGGRFFCRDFCGVKKYKRKKMRKDVIANPQGEAIQKHLLFFIINYSLD
jgi:hypothetical protein